MTAATLAAPRGQGRGPLDRPWPTHLSALFLETSESPASVSPAMMINSSSSSHAQWQGTTRWKQGWSNAWKGWDDSSATASPTHNPEHVSDERFTTALHMMLDHLQQTTVISQRRSQKTLTEQTASRTKGNAAYEAMEAATQARECQEKARLVYEQEGQDTAERKTIFNDAIKNTLEKTKHLRNTSRP